MTSSLILTPPESSPAAVNLHAKTDQELDLLPYGVIALDRAGIVVRYNRVEARLARLDRAVVLGKDFFRTIAPCAATPEFEGRFRAFVAEPNGPTRVRFQYVFNFRFGSQEVDVDFVRSTSPEHVYVCVGRRAFRRVPIREVPGGDLDGIAQSELAPDEAKKGVMRDPLERRHVVLDASFLSVLSASFKREPPGSLQDLGVAFGRRIALDLEAEAGESFDVGLRDLPIATLMELFAQTFARQGWGALTVDLRPARSGLVTFNLERSAFAEAPGILGAKRCALVSGMLQAMLSHVAASPMTVRESRCASEGADACSFVATGAKRAASLDAAIVSAGSSGVSAVLLALGDRE